jgi:hypothetical protein
VTVVELALGCAPETIELFADQHYHVADAGVRSQYRERPSETCGSQVLDLGGNNFVPAMPARTTRALDPPGAYRSPLDTGQESRSLLRRRATRLASS